MSRVGVHRMATAGLLLLAAAAAAGAAGGRPGQRRTVTGTLRVLQEDDFEGHGGRRLYFLEPGDGAPRVRLELLRRPAARLLSGALVRASGTGPGDTLSVDASDPTAFEVLAVAPAVTGQRHAVVLLVDFEGAPVECSDGSIRSLMFEGDPSVDGLYAATSHGSVAFPGDTDGDGIADVFRVSPGVAPAGCDPQAWASAADEAAASAVDLGLYRHRVYVLPQATDCSWAGLANVGCGTYCRVWIRTCGLPDVFAHELGHNLGMAHASTDADQDGAIDAEYGDRSDFMGIGGIGYRGLNGPHVDQMGWLPPERIADAEAGTNSYVLSPLHLDPELAPYPQLLRIRRPRGGEDYWVSYRRREGYDASLSQGYVDRASVHTYPGSGARNTLLVGTLQDGGEVADPAGGVTLTQVSHDADSVTLLVDIETDCAAGIPEVRVSPARGLGRPGDAVSFEVTVANRDPEACDPVRFGLSAQPPGGWSTLFDPQTLTLAPGEEGTSRLSVRSAPEAADGTYTLRVVAEHVDPARDGAADVPCTVDGTPPPPVAGLRASGRSGTRVWLVWDPVADAGPLLYRIYRDGEAIAVTGQTRHLDGGLAPGTSHVYHVTAVDGAGNESAPGAAAEARPAIRGGSGTRDGGSARARN